MACRAAPVTEGLLTSDGRFDRSAITRKAHKELAEQMPRHDYTPFIYPALFSVEEVEREILCSSIDRTTV